MHTFLKPLLLAALLLGVATAAHSRPEPKLVPGGPQAHVEGDDAPKVPDDRVIRLVTSDLCWPANGKEYEGLGKHAVLMLTATSMFPDELPLSAAYIQGDGATVPLRRIALFDVPRPKGTDGSKRTHASQVSFYLIPINLTKKEARLIVDFTGERKGFSVTDFSRVGLDPRLPEAIRGDKQDAPGEPDMGALQRLLVREYPDYFPEESVKP